MGFLSKLFGSSKKSASAPSFDKAELMRITDNPIQNDEQAEQILDLVGRVKNFNNRVEAFNILTEEGRKEWAEAYARVIAGMDDTPPTILRALAVQHFLEEGKLEEFFEPARRVLDEFPSETDLALGIGRVHLANGDFEKALEDLHDPLESAPDSRHLFALVGEAYRGLKKHEEAMIHLRTSLELYCEAFKLQMIITNELQVEEFEFTRIYGVLEEEALSLYGKEEKAKAFETIYVTPGEIGVRREGDRMALMRVEYKPKQLGLPSLEDLSRLEEELENEKSAKHLYRATIALRKDENQSAIDSFRRALELDLESHGAYFGWAAAGEMQRNADLQNATTESLSDDEMGGLKSIFEDWDALTGLEKNLAQVCAAPIKSFLKPLSESGSKVYLHPLDVRLKDVFPEPKELLFERHQKNPAVADSYTSNNESHLRLDAFLTFNSKRVALAYHLGLLAYQKLEDKSKVEKAFRAEKEAHKLTKDHAGFFACAVEIAVQKALVGNTELEPEVNLSDLL